MIHSSIPGGGTRIPGDPTGPHHLQGAYCKSLASAGATATFIRWTVDVRVSTLRPALSWGECGQCVALLVCQAQQGGGGAAGSNMERMGLSEQ